MKKKLIQLTLFFSLFFIQSLIAQNVGFEAMTISSPPANWTAVTGTWNVNTNPIYVRTGANSMTITDPATSGTTIGTVNPILSTNSAGYLIVIGWGKSNTANNALFHTGYRLGTTNTLNPSTTTTGQPANLNDVTWSRITSVSASGTITANNYGIAIRAFRSASTANTQLYFDDFIIYSSQSDIPDYSAPNAPANSSISGNYITWSNGLDNGAPASGIGGTVIIRADGAGIPAPTLNDQAMYSPINGEEGVSSFLDGTVTWTVVANINNAATLDFTDFTAGSGPYTYYIYSRDLAYNYSSGAIVNPAAACINPPTAGVSIANLTNPICNGQQIILSLTGNSVGLTQTYQWQSSTTLGGTYSNIGTASGSPVIILNPTSTLFYRCEVVCASGIPVYSTPVEVQVSPGFAGAFTINSSLPTGNGNFQTFTSAINAMINCGITGPVQFNVAPASGPYNEQITIPEIIGSSSNNTITFNGNGNTISFSPTVSAERHVIRLSGADYVTFDNLNVQVNGTSNAFAIHLTNNSDNNTIANCVINANITESVSSIAGIVISGSTTSVTTSGSNCENNLIINNTVTGGYYGISSAGSATINSNNQILNNTILDFYLYGVYINDENGVLIADNNISRPTRNNVSTFSAIYLTGGTVNTKIRGNKIHNGFGGNLASTSASNAININSSDATLGNENVVFNNLIYNINGKGAQTGLFNTGSNFVLCYHNTVILDDTASNTATTRGIYQTTAASGLDFKNNLIVISRAGTGAKHCVYLNTATTTGTLNRNNYLMTSTGGTTNNIGYLTTNHPSLLDWQTAVSQDLNSTNIDPLFVNPSAGNFTPSNTLLDNTCQNVGITNDINGILRSPTNPDVGAIEFGNIPCSQPSGLNAVNITFSGADILWDTIVGILSYEYVLNQVATAPTGSGTIVNANSYSAGGLSPNTTYYFHVRTDCGNSNLSAWTTFSFTTACAGLSSVITPMGSTTFCDGQSVTLSANSGPNYSYQWRYNSNIIAGANDSIYLATVAGDYTLDVSNSPGCTTTSSIISVAINPLPAVNVNAPSTNICVSGSVNLAANTASGNSYQWFSGTSILNNDTLSILTVSAAGNFRVLITDINGCSDTSAFVQVNVFDPQVLSVMGDTICGIGSANLSATSSAGSTINWYANQSGGTALAAGNTFSTPSISSTTTYYAAPADGASTVTTGRLVPLTTASTVLTTYGPIFTINQPIVLNSVKVISTTGTAITVSLYNNNGSSQLMTTGSISVPTNDTNTINLGWSLQAGTYRLIANGMTGNFIRESSGTTYPIPLSTVGQIDGYCTTITGGLTTGTPYYWFYSWNISTSCEGPRVPVTATVVNAPSIAASANISSICSGNNATLTVTSTNSNYTYTWSPGNQTGNSITVNPTSITEYIVSAVDNSSGAFNGCANSDTLSVNVQPALSAMNAVPDILCFSGTSTLSVTPNSGYTNGSIEWFSSLDGQNYISVSGQNGVTYTTGLIDTLTYFRVQIKDGNNTVCSEMYDTVLVQKPQLISVTDGSSCVPSSVQLSGVSQAGTSINWYTAPTGGAPFNSGSTFTTPFIFNSTTYYASASIGGGTQSTGLASAPSNYTSGAGTTNFGMVFDVFAPFTLNSVTIYPVSSSSSAGTVTIDVVNGSGTILHTVTVPVVGAPAASAHLNPVVIPLNFYIAPGTNYKIKHERTGITGLLFGPSAQAPAGNYGYPFVIPGVLSINHSTLTAAPTNTPRPDLYYYFFNWQVSTGCESPRVPVNATIFALPSVNLGNDTTFCDNISVNLDAGNFVSYAWSTGANSQNISVNTSGTYSVTVTDTNACTNADTIVVTANPTPNPSLSDISNCTGQAETLNPGVSPAGNTFNWSNGQSTPTISVTSSGTYIVTVTNDGSGCSGIDTAVVNINTAQAIGLSNAIVCDYNSITLTVPSSFTGVTWSTGATGNSVTIAGSSLPIGANNITINAIDANGCATTQTIVLTVDRCLSVSERANSNNIKVYPNPSSGKINVETENISNAVLEVIDLNGRVLLTQKLGNDVKLHNVDLTGTSSGMYFLKITGDGFQNVERITIR